MEGKFVSFSKFTVLEGVRVVVIILVNKINGDFGKINGLFGKMIASFGKINGLFGKMIAQFRITNHHLRKTNLIFEK